MYRFRKLSFKKDINMLQRMVTKKLNMFYLGFARFIATGFYVGYFPVAPGTIGSFLAVLIFIGSYSFMHVIVNGLTMDGWFHLEDLHLLFFSLNFLALLIWLILGFWSVGMLLRQTIPNKGWNNYRKKTDLDDPSEVVIDEIIGQWIVLMFLPFIIGGLSWHNIIFAFLLFRLFDVWKPWWVRRMDNKTGTIGVILDDVTAGVFAVVVLSVCRWLANLS